MINQPTFTRLQVVAVPAMTIVLAWTMLYQARNSLKASGFIEKLEANQLTATIKTTAENTNVAKARSQVLASQTLIQKPTINRSSEIPTPSVKQPQTTKIATPKTNTEVAKPIQQPSATPSAATQLPLPLALAMRQAETLQKSNIDPLISNDSSNIIIRRRPSQRLAATTRFSSAYSQQPVEISDPPAQTVTVVSNPQNSDIQNYQALPSRVSIPPVQTVAVVSNPQSKDIQNYQALPSRVSIPPVQTVTVVSNPQNRDIQNYQALPSRVNIPPVQTVTVVSNPQSSNAELPQQVTTEKTQTVALMPQRTESDQNYQTLPPKITTLPALPQTSTTQTNVTSQNYQTLPPKITTLPTLPQTTTTQTNVSSQNYQTLPPKITTLPALPQTSTTQTVAIAPTTQTNVSSQNYQTLPPKPAPAIAITPHSPLPTPHSLLPTPQSVTVTPITPQPIAKVTSPAANGGGASALKGTQAIEVVRPNTNPNQSANSYNNAGKSSVNTDRGNQVTRSPREGVLSASVPSSSTTLASTPTRQTQVVAEQRRIPSQTSQRLITQQPNYVGESTATTQPPPSHDIDELEEKLREISEKTNFGDVYRGSPGLTIVNPAGFGADRNTAFLSATYQQRTRYTNKSDGAVGVGVGLGDARRSVGVELSYTIASFGTSRDFGSGGFNVKLHRQLSDDLSVAVGWNGFLNVGGRNDFQNSLYGSATKIFRVTENINRPFSRIAVTAGIGNGQFRSENDVKNDHNSFNPFGSVAVRVAEPVSAIAEWTGQDLAMGVSFVPIQRKNFSWTITPAVRDIVGAGDGPRFVLGTGVSFQF